MPISKNEAAGEGASYTPSGQLTQAEINMIVKAKQAADAERRARRALRLAAIEAEGGDPDDDPETRDPDDDPETRAATKAQRKKKR